MNATVIRLHSAGCDARLPRPRARVSCGRRAGAVVALIALLCVGSPATAVAARADVGHPGPSHVGTTTPTGTKRSESILWFNDGLWWANMWNIDTNDFAIFRLDGETKTWVPTPTTVDWRPNTHADVLWTGTKLYVASHRFIDDQAPAVPGFPSYLFRFSYDPVAKEYMLDPGFPTEINNYRSETLVIDRDSAGTLWATWQQDGVIHLNRTVGPDDVWGTPFPLPTATKVSVDDSSAVLAMGKRVLVMWSNQLPGAVGMYYSLHEDGADPGTWSSMGTAISGPGTADDHMNLKWLDEGGGRVFATVKTSFTKPARTLIMLLVLDVAAGTWKQYPIADVSDCPNRMILMIDPEHRMLYAYGSYPVAPDFPCSPNGGTINEKSSPLGAIAFGEGRGTPRIVADGGALRSVTSTKQNVDGRTGIAIVADAPVAQRYHFALRSLVPNP